MEEFISRKCDKALSVASSSWRDIKKSLDRGRPRGMLLYEPLWCHDPCYLCMSDTYLADMT